MFKTDNHNISTAEISRQAAAWWVQLKDEQRISSRKAWQFVLWLMRSHRHVVEYILIGRQDRELTRALRARRHPSNVTHVNWWQGSALKAAAPRPRHPAIGWSVAAAALAVICVGFFVAGKNAGVPNGTIATAGSEWQVRRLEDGSRVTLDANSTLRVAFTDARRDVHLFQGKAMFEVSTDTARPFVVNTFLVGIKAVESTFAVTIDTSVEVEVLDGEVEVSGRGAHAGAPVRSLKKGEKYRAPVDEFRVAAADGSNGRLSAALIEG
jgi:transmembrane sensor